MVTKKSFIHFCGNTVQTSTARDVKFWAHSLTRGDISLPIYKLLFNPMIKMSVQFRQMLFLFSLCSHMFPSFAKFRK